ncbi:MAG: response regulator [Bacteroidota bacterium]
MLLHTTFSHHKTAMSHLFPYEVPIVPKQARTVFLVEDEPLQQQLMLDYLKDKFTLDVHGFSSGEEALSQLHLKPEVVILDYHLDSSDPAASNGVEILKKIREALPLTQVIMLSSQDKISVSVECMKYGAYDYVVKGDSALSRLQHIFGNIDEMMDNIYFRKFYKDMLMLLSIGIVLFFAFMAYALHAGWAQISFDFGN